MNAKMAAHAAGDEGSQEIPFVHTAGNRSGINRSRQSADGQTLVARETDGQNYVNRNDQDGNRNGRRSSYAYCGIQTDIVFLSGETLPHKRLSRLAHRQKSFHDYLHHSWKQQHNRTKLDSKRSGILYVITHREPQQSTQNESHNNRIPQNAHLFVHHLHVHMQVLKPGIRCKSTPSHMRWAQWKCLQPGEWKYRALQALPVRPWLCNPPF